MMGLAVPATTERTAVGASGGQQRAYTQYLTLTVRQVAGILFQPVAPVFMQDTFNVTTQQPARTYADYTNPNNEQFPIRPKDHLVVNGSTYMIHGVNTWPPYYFEIYVALVPL